MYMTLRAWLAVHPAIGVFIIAAAIRLFFVVLIPISAQNGDFPVYWEAAQFFLGNGELSGDPYVAPGLSFLMLGSTLLFGDTLSALAIGYGLVGALTVVGVFKFGQYVYGKKAGFVAGIAYALWPLSIYQGFALGQTPILSAALVVWGLYFLWRGAMESQAKFLLVAGVILGGFALTDVIGLYLPVVLIPWLVWTVYRRVSFRHVLLCVLIFVVGFLAILLPWTYRNVQVAGGAQNAPIVAKAIEKTAFQGLIIKRAVQFYRPKNMRHIMTAVGSLVFVPYDLGMLSRLETTPPLAYKEVAVRMFKEGLGGLSWRQVGILSGKIAFGLVRVILLAATVMAVWRVPRRSAAWALGALFITVIAYTAFATISYASLWEHGFLKNISPLPNFFFPLEPIIFALGVPMAVTMLRESRLFRKGRGRNTMSTSIGTAAADTI